MDDTQTDDSKDIVSKPPLQLEREKKIMAFIADLPSNIRPLFTKAFDGNSRAAALKAKCIICMGCEDYRTRICECKTVICPLHPYRPYQKGGEEDAE